MLPTGVSGHVPLHLKFFDLPLSVDTVQCTVRGGDGGIVEAVPRPIITTPTNTAACLCSRMVVAPIRMRVVVVRELAATCPSAAHPLVVTRWSSPAHSVCKWCQQSVQSPECSVPRESMFCLAEIV